MKLLRNPLSLVNQESQESFFTLHTIPNPPTPGSEEEDVGYRPQEGIYRSSAADLTFTSLNFCITVSNAVPKSLEGGTRASRWKLSPSP